MNDIKQRTPEWFAAKLGNLSASRLFDIIPGKRGGYLESRSRLLWELLAERITGTRVEKFVTSAMQYGIDMEPYARALYEDKFGAPVIEVGYIKHPTIQGLGASPDGLVDSDGLIEIKCPTTQVALKAWAGEDIDPAHMFQMQTQMACTKRAWCDYVVFDQRLPVGLEMYSKRIKRDRFVIELIEFESVKFLTELNGLEKKIRERMAI